MDRNRDGLVDETEAIAWSPIDHSMISGEQCDSNI